jgi:uncharacterized protein YndB with AHSA1/START domain
MDAVVHSTYVIEKTFAGPPERVFRAFSEPEKKRLWFANDAGVTEFKADFRLGGCEYTRRNTPLESPMKGASLTNETTYLDLVPDRRIVFAYTMAVGGTRISASLVTIELAPTSDGRTDLTFTDQAAFFEGADGVTIREQGWRSLLEGLEKTL